MSNFLVFYLTLQVLLSLSYIFVSLLKSHNMLFDYKTLLRLSYGLLFISFLIPSVFKMIPTQNPFGPVLKVWSEPVGSGVEIINQTVKVKALETAISQESNLNVSALVLFLVVCLIIIYFIMNLYRLLRSYFTLCNIVKYSFLLKKKPKCSNLVIRSSEHSLFIL